MCVLAIKVPIRKKYGNLFNDPRIYTILRYTCSITNIESFLLINVANYIYIYMLTQTTRITTQSFTV